MHFFRFQKGMMKRKTFERFKMTYEMTLYEVVERYFMHIPGVSLKMLQHSLKYFF